MGTTKKTAGGTKAAPRLKNYASEASMTSIFNVISTILAQHKAKKITFDYDDAGRAVSLEFMVTLNGQQYRFRLPARFDKAKPLVEKARQEAGSWRLSEKALDEQSYRAVWATIRDWVDAQCALIDIGASSIEETFMPYLIIDEGSGRTMFDVFAEQKALPSPRHNTVITEETL